MNCVFRTYPPHPWLNHWLFEPRGCGTAFREINAACFFQSRETVGRIGPNVETPEWSLQIPIPQNSRINLLFNGFCGYFEQKNTLYCTEVLTPEPGVCWGRFSNIAPPVLLSGAPIDEAGAYRWLDVDTVPALLAIRDGMFCLVTHVRIFEDAVQRAESWLEKDFETRLAEELDHRAGAAALFEQMNHHDALTVISAECMMRAVRPAEGSIHGLWSQSSAATTPHLDANELYTLALAWRHLDPVTAEELLRTLLKVQTSSGAIPVTYAPHETFSVLEAPKPLLAKMAEEVWMVRRDPQFLDDIILPLRRYLQWLLHHFDPKRRGLHCWQNSREPLTPEIYESDLATADLTALLLTEIEALDRLQQASPTHAYQARFFDRERENLEQNLQTLFWNEEESQFSQAVIRGRITHIRGLTALVPLLWKKMPLSQRNQVMEKIQESGNLPGGVSLLSWKKSSLSDQSFPLLQQLLVLEILKEADPSGTLVIGFARLIIQGFVEWHTLVTEELGTLQLDPAAAAFIINLQEAQHRRHQAKGAFSSSLYRIWKKTRADWFEMVVVVAAILAIVIVHTIYKQTRQPPPLILLEAQMNSAYAKKEIERTLLAGQAIIRHYPGQSVMAKFMTANVLLIDHRYEEAIPLLADVRAAYPDSPGPMIALGLALQLQGNFEEAGKNYTEFNYLFGEIFPEIVEIIEKNRRLMEEGFREPPKWAEIYRYQLMHEL